MAVEFGLPADVREKYGLPEVVSYDFDTLMLDEAIALDDELGWTPAELITKLNTPVIDPATGEQQVDADGKRMVRRNLRAYKFIIWCAVVRAGAKVAYADFDLNLQALTAHSTAVDDAGPKEAETDDPSTPEKPSVEPVSPSGPSEPLSPLPSPNSST